MPKVDIDALEKLYNESTPGPWIVRDMKFVHAPCPCCGDVAECVQYGPGNDKENYNTEIIVAMHTALPHLITELRAARRKNRKK